ncbi:ROK family protein [Geobacter sulfurreducens]|uniref:ROK family protein n=1 Tax=Geobacter sulfurreducens TaxID=35554 RepID=UPI002BB2CB37|nr:ROK family protein [Geobacter sulfurreducens]HML78280.1 ROK family protein [Geobacter sulfurreducens]
MIRPAFIGMDIGGTNLRMGLVDEAGTIHCRFRQKTDIHEGRAAFYEKLAEGLGILREHAAQTGFHIVAVGAGVPGLVANDGHIHVSVNLPAIDSINLRNDLERISGLPATVANDVNATAYGEKSFGAGREFDSFLMVTLGTGVGGGLILNGRLWTGIDGVAGEFGHVTVEPQGTPCPCGNRGCLEQYASATAIASAAQDAMMGGRYVPVDGAGTLLTTQDLARLAREGDGIAAAFFAEAGRYLGMATASMANVLNLEALIVGGGVAASFDLIRGSIEREVRARAFPIPAQRLVVIRCALGDDGGLLGSAALARDEFHI